MDKTKKFQEETKQVVEPGFELAWEKKAEPEAKEEPKPAPKKK